LLYDSALASIGFTNLANMDDYGYTIEQFENQAAGRKTSFRIVRPGTIDRSRDCFGENYGFVAQLGTS
jgi:hypothetical protein